MWSEPIPAVARQRFPGRYGRLSERSDRCDHLAAPEFFCAAFLRSLGGLAAGDDRGWGQLSSVPQPSAAA